MEAEGDSAVHLSGDGEVRVGGVSAPAFSQPARLL